MPGVEALRVDPSAAAPESDGVAVDGDVGLLDDLLQATAVARTAAAVHIRTFRIIR
jgi:hypothetical protein